MRQNLLNALVGLHGLLDSHFHVVHTALMSELLLIESELPLLDGHFGLCVHLVGLKVHSLEAEVLLAFGVDLAVGAAADIMTIAGEESAAASGERDAAEKERLLEVLGADPSARTQPPHIRAQVSALEREQKARATRFTRDVVDRALLDLLSVYRDALVVRAGAGTPLVNEDSRQVVARVAEVLTADQLLRAMDAIGTARERIGANVAPLLALEAMALDLRLPR